MMMIIFIQHHNHQDQMIVLVIVNVNFVNEKETKLNKVVFLLNYSKQSNELCNYFIE